MGLPGCLFLMFLIPVGLLLLVVWLAGMFAVSLLRIFMPGLATPKKPSFFANGWQRYRNFSGTRSQDTGRNERARTQNDDDIIECEVIHTESGDVAKDRAERKMIEQTDTSIQKENSEI